MQVNSQFGSCGLEDATRKQCNQYYNTRFANRVDDNRGRLCRRKSLKVIEYSSCDKVDGDESCQYQNKTDSNKIVDSGNFMVPF